MKTCIKLVLLHVAYPFAHAKRALRPSGVTTASATPAMQGWHLGGGGGILPNLLFFKRKIVRRGSKMDHISANLAFGGREKNIWGYKISRGARSL